MKRLILWINDVDMASIIWAFVLLALMSFLLGLGLTALRCSCDPIQEHGPLLSSWAIAASVLLGGFSFPVAWSCLVAWAERPPLIPPRSSDDRLLRAAEAEVELLLRGPEMDSK